MPLVSDASSDIFSRPIDVAKHGLIYAGAQKNLGPVRRHARHRPRRSAEASPASLPTMLSYAVHAENKSLYNTPPVFGIYILGLVLKWLIAQGGLTAIEAVNERKAAKLYAEIDRTGLLSRSRARRIRGRG